MQGDGAMCASIGLPGRAHMLGLSKLSVGFTDAGGLGAFDFPLWV